MIISKDFGSTRALPIFRQTHTGLPWITKPGPQELTGQQITDTLHPSWLGWLRLIHPCVTCIVKSI